MTTGHWTRSSLTLWCVSLLVSAYFTVLGAPAQAAPPNGIPQPCQTAVKSADSIGKEAGQLNDEAQSAKKSAESLQKQLDTLTQEIAALQADPAFVAYQQAAAALEAHNQAVEAHNANPPNPYSASAVNAYNNRAHELNLAGEGLQKNADATAAAAKPVIQKLDQKQGELTTLSTQAQQAQEHATDLQSQLAQLSAQSNQALTVAQTCQTEIQKNYGEYPMPKPSVAAIKGIESAKAKVPENWVAPPNGVVSIKDPDVGALVQILRRTTPSGTGYAGPLQGVPKPRTGDPDPSRPGATIGGTKSNPYVHQDHIIPYSAIIALPGFMDLTAENMIWVVSVASNLQWLPGRTNAGKGNRSAADLAGVAPEWQAEQLLLEQRTKELLLVLIAGLVAAQ